MRQEIIVGLVITHKLRSWHILQQRSLPYKTHDVSAIIFVYLTRL